MYLSVVANGNMSCVTCQRHEPRASDLLDCAYKAPATDCRHGSGDTRCVYDDETPPQA